jgi:3-deoxy-D-manno-octulosonic acid kinase
VIPETSHDVARRAIGNGAILFDARRFAQAGAEVFDPAHWPDARAGNDDGGRGSVWYVKGAFGQGVLRHYRRGGLVGRVVRDRYWWQGEERTRSFREFRLLHELARRGLRVPQPLAAGYLREGPCYRADLITALVPGVQTLAQRIAGDYPSSPTWERLGATLARFHAEGVFHADLNAHNILLDQQHDAWLIDFDRGELRTPARAWQDANLRRLQRSLHKLGAAVEARHAAAWEALLRGYAQSRAAASPAGAT